MARITPDGALCRPYWDSGGLTSLVRVYGSRRDDSGGGWASWLAAPDGGVAARAGRGGGGPVPGVVVERDGLAGEVERLRADNQRLVARVGELACQVEELRRAGKRQAAPFSKDRPAAHPRRPGRKAGAAYGRHGRRPVPERVDRSWWWRCRMPALAAVARCSSRWGSPPMPCSASRRSPSSSPTAAW